MTQPLWDPTFEKVILGVAHALFMNRLHVLRLTEVVRLGIRPSSEDGNLELPAGLDYEMRQQAIDYVLTCLPPEVSVLINQAKSDWLRPA
ncbi:MAG TPA: hypothetical protein VFG83_12525 [Kofleriaceae bacterium]|nr:hypothetical protein [Kofleriaceae bacterium]